MTSSARLPADASRRWRPPPPPSRHPSSPGSQACTSLSDEDATARMNLLPPGTSGGWQLTTDPANHRHLIFGC
ncbi:hypothetical protein [Micromonospora aurantiaca (nom. illeg.)]|uniref:Uncharacterized protein n=1 Tax=Micromonospora aurantiaca (nom. illeg.) TaxID=47850 RepID=A0ABQ6UP25_9ACTN|nr:hypothetical protein [Micromonospora aurantiaca]KAB1119074.1 hypothetical protein F6X54_01365 [Micromonospora aurantiaca]MBC9005685.1 hypothetical protein [Micromonospora aurantiaca]